MAMIKKVQIFLLALGLAYTAQAQQKQDSTWLPTNLQELFTGINQGKLSLTGQMGVAAWHLERNDTITFNMSQAFPMQSVYKFPLAIYILHLVDQKTLSLNQTYLVKKEDLHDTWSPLRDKYPKGNVQVTLAELLNYTVSYSDNNTCDILFKLAGGPQKVDAYFKTLGLQDINIRNTEVEMHKDWDVQYRNNSTPWAMLNLLKQFQQKELLSDTSNAFLMQLMTQSHNSAMRIGAGLPAGSVYAHKSGTAHSGKPNQKATVNDVGIIQMPDGSHVLLVVFISRSEASLDDCEGMIAYVTKLVYKYYLK